MDIKPVNSIMHRFQEVFKTDYTKIYADKNTADVKVDNTGRIFVNGGKNVKIYHKNDCGEGHNNLRISLNDSEISKLVALNGRSQIVFNNCKFYTKGDKKGLLNLIKESQISLGGPNNKMIVNGDLKGLLNTYSFGDNESLNKDRIIIKGENYAKVVSGIHDEIKVKGKDYTKDDRILMDDRIYLDIMMKNVCDNEYGSEESY